MTDEQKAANDKESNIHRNCKNRLRKLFLTSRDGRMIRAMRKIWSEEMGLMDYSAAFL